MTISNRKEKDKIVKREEKDENPPLEQSIGIRRELDIIF